MLNIKKQKQNLTSLAMITMNQGNQLLNTWQQCMKGTKNDNKNGSCTTFCDAEKTLHSVFNICLSGYNVCIMDIINSK